MDAVPESFLSGTIVRAVLMRPPDQARPRFLGEIVDVSLKMV